MYIYEVYEYEEDVLMGIEVHVESECYPLFGFSPICLDLCDKNTYLLATV